jgi:hypothetical protein
VHYCARLLQKETGCEPFCLVEHKGSWVSLDLGCGLAALSPLPRGNGTIETKNGDFGAAKMRFDEGEERREGGICSNGLPDLLSTWRA